MKVNWFRNLAKQAGNEPLALIAILLTTLGFIYEREFFQDWLRVEPAITAYHSAQQDGRCPMVAFEVENDGSKIVSNIRITILEDWITARGDEQLFIYTFEEAFVPPNEQTIMLRRDPLDVSATMEGNTFVIPELQPGQYVQRLIPRSVSAIMNDAREALADDPRHWNRPRIGQATYEHGLLPVKHIGECLSRD